MLDLPEPFYMKVQSVRLALLSEQEPSRTSPVLYNLKVSTVSCNFQGEQQGRVLRQTHIALNDLSQPEMLVLTATVYAVSSTTSVFFPRALLTIGLEAVQDELLDTHCAGDRVSFYCSNTNSQLRQRRTLERCLLANDTRLCKSAVMCRWY